MLFCIHSKGVSSTSNTIFLTNHEVTDLTGYRVPSKQIRWLRDEGFKFKVAADGYPRVMHSEVLFHMSHSDGMGKKEQNSKPNIEGLKKWVEKEK